MSLSVFLLHKQFSSILPPSLSHYSLLAYYCFESLRLLSLCSVVISFLLQSEMALCIQLTDPLHPSIATVLLIHTSYIPLLFNLFTSGLELELGINNTRRRGCG